VPGYAAVTLSLKRGGTPPGDATADEMEAIAALADRFSFGELRVSHEQNLIFADVAKRDLHALWTALRGLGMATPNVGLLTNIVACPGGDFCSLANARSLPIAAAIRARFEDLDYLFDVGELDLNISGCMNACGHHHVGHIGILGVDKNGAEFYQIEIGGNQGQTRPGASVALGKALGRSFAADEVPDAIERLVNRYLELRDSETERFIDTVQRVGTDPFKASLYDQADPTPQTRSRRLAAA
jgi:sulfite reductase (NADPH) hemoprotein beta-component